MTNKSRGKNVRIQEVCKAYGAATVLDSVSLEIPAGCFCTLLGASGSGKTTLLKLIAGFERPDAGAILVGNRDIGPIPVSRRNIGMVFQNYALFPHMTVRRNVAFGLEMRHLRRSDISRRVEEALSLVELTAFAERHPRQLSGGQQQRVALARALVIQPDILLMDEPLAALDKALRQGLQFELKQLHQHLGVTIIFVTHDQEEALHLSDMVVVINRGRIEQAGTPRELYLAPANRFVASFLGECNFREISGQTYGIRPERVSIGPGATGLAHRLDAVVDNLVFLGHGIRVALRTDEGPFVAVVPLNAVTSQIEPGQRVHVGFAEQDIMPLSLDRSHSRSPGIRGDACCFAESPT